MPIDLAEFRKELHANPELSGHEKETQQRIKKVLKDHVDLEGQDVGSYGTLYSFEFGEGPHLLVRVDIDALPIQEVNEFKHRSKFDNVSHKCGHDGHTTIGVGLAMKLSEHPLSKGRVTVLFQPSEENGEGARGVIDDPNFHTDNYDYAVALHNIPGRPMHHILWKKDGFTPAVQSLIVRFKGKTSHAAEPAKGMNPSYAIADVIKYAQEAEVLDETSPNYHLITPVYSCLGSKDYGISAGYGEVHFTIRSWKQQRMEDVTATLLEKVKSLSSTYRLNLETEIVATFAANENDHFVVGKIKQASEKLKLNAIEKNEPFPWGEDFGLFTQKVPGAMFGLGSGENTPALHNPDYEFPDEIIETGVDMFYTIAKSICADV